MDAVLYAEIYFICILVAALLLYWMIRREAMSTEELWLKRVLISFTLNFFSNFLFTIFNRIHVIPAAVEVLSYALKTLYFLTLSVGVFCWCGYAEATLRSGVFDGRRSRLLLYAALGAALAIPLANLFTHHMFDFSQAHAYRRHGMFQAEMWLLFLGSAVCSCRLLRQAGFEADPIQRGHLRLTASFPLCLLAAIILSYAGEAVPVICVCIMVELLCLYMGTTARQISMDKLTQVNNRQNLIGFMNYKLKNHSGELYLLMIDLDYFKTINDTYGHLEGDRALTQPSGVLKRACGPYTRRPYIARYGGDEFIIVMEGTQAEAEALCESIRALLAECNARSDTYEICVSIGCARWQEGMDQKELIAAADEELYRIKRAREK